MTDYQPFIYNDIDGNSLTFHGGGQDDDGQPTVAVEADQIGRGIAWVHVRHTDAARVADELRAAAGLSSAPADRAVELLRRTESYLSALHGSVARHDNLAANLGCAGCELRDQITTVLRRVADETPQPETEARRACTNCGHFICGDPSPCRAITHVSAVSDEQRCGCTARAAVGAQQPKEARP